MHGQTEGRKDRRTERPYFIGPTRLHSGVQKSALINDWENIFGYWKESEQSKVNKLGLFQVQFGGLGGSTTPEKFCNFFLHLI